MILQNIPNVCDIFSIFQNFYMNSHHSDYQTKTIKCCFKKINYYSWNALIIFLIDNFKIYENALDLLGKFKFCQSNSLVVFV